MSSFAPQRPFGVAVLTVLQVLVGLFSITVSLLLEIGTSAVIGNPKMGSELGAFVFIIVILGIFSIIMSYGVSTRKRWAWTYSVMVAALGILTNITAFFFGSTISALNAGLQALVIYYLTRSNVKSYFPKLYTDQTK